MKIAGGARDSAQAKLSELTNLLLPFAIRGLATLGVADVLASGPQPVETIAEAVNADVSALYRTMRFTASRGVFVEFPGRVFALTAIANWMRSDIAGSMQPRLMIDDGLVSRLKVFTEVLHTLHTGEPAYQKVTGTNPFGASAADRALAARMHRQLRPGGQVWPDRLLESITFDNDRLLVDVGGGAGSAIGKILASYAELSGVLLDLDTVVPEAVTALEAAGVRDRCEVVGGDMFAEVPAGGDSYLLSFVLHNWPDDQAGTVLSNIRKAIPSGGRLLVVEALISDDREQAAPAVQQDFMMLLNGGGRERTVDEHTTLLERAGFRLDTLTLLSHGIALLQARPVADEDNAR